MCKKCDYQRAVFCCDRSNPRLLWRRIRALPRDMSFADGGGGGLNALAAIAAARIVGGSGATDLSGWRKSASGSGPRRAPSIPSRLLAERAVVPVQQFLGVRVRPERGEDRRAARLAEHADVVRRAIDDRGQRGAAPELRIPINLLGRARPDERHDATQARGALLIREVVGA